MTRLRALTMEEWLDKRKVVYQDTMLEDSKYTLGILVPYYGQYTEGNKNIAVYCALETMFKFGWDMPELQRIAYPGLLSTYDLLLAGRLLLEV